MYKLNWGLATVSHILMELFFLNVFIYSFFLLSLFVFMLLSDAKRDVLPFATAAFACAAGRSEPLESDWKDLFPALFNYDSLDAEARPPSEEEEQEKEGRGGRRQRSASPHETWMVLAVGAEASDFETCVPKFTVLNWRPFQLPITFKLTKFNPLW